MSERTRERLVIIGSGPAAWTAAIYAARANLDPIVFEGAGSRTMIPGGQLMFTTDIENYPGFPEPVSGQELMKAFRDQATRFGTRVETDDIVRVDLHAYPRRLYAADGREIDADAVIVATGANAKWLDVPGEEKLARNGGGVSACAVCDGALPFYRNRVLAVVGGGDTAMEEATYLTKFASRVSVVHRRDELRASKVMQDRAFAHPRIDWKWNAVVSEVIGTREGGIEAVRLQDTVTGEESVYPTQGVFIAIGHQPNTAIFAGKLAMNEVGYLLVDAPSSRTSLEGVFAAGDVVDPHYRQAVTAAGTGCVASLDAERWLEAQEAAHPASRQGAVGLDEAATA